MDWNAHKTTWPMAEHSRFVLSRPHKWHVQQAGSGPLVLLIHGAGGATQSWRHLFPLLIPHFTVVAFDLPGQGFTRLGAPDRCGLDPMTLDIHALCRQEGWRPHALIGHSAGGAIALRLAELMARHPPAVVGINAALDTFKGLAGVLFPAMAKTLAMMPMVADLFTASTARRGSVERLIAGTGSHLPREDLDWYRALVSDRAHVNATLQMMAQWNLSPLIGRLREHPSRALLLAGDNDRAVPPGVSFRAAAAIPHARAARLQNLGHLAHEEDAAGVRDAMLPFLQGK